MAPDIRKNLNRQWFKTIKERAKKVIADNGIKPSTRKGSKALNHALMALSLDPIIKPSEAIALGDSIGQAIVDLSKQYGKENLDERVVLEAITQDKLPEILKQSPAQMKTESASSAK